jgi:hypothetical protein
MNILHGVAQWMPKFVQESNSVSNIAGQMTHNNKIASSIPPPILMEDVRILHGLLQGILEFEQASNSLRNIVEQMTHDNHVGDSHRGPLNNQGKPTFFRK